MKRSITGWREKNKQDGTRMSETKFKRTGQSNKQREKHRRNKTKQKR